MLIQTLWCESLPPRALPPGEQMDAALAFFALHEQVVKLALYCLESTGFSAGSTQTLTVCALPWDCLFCSLRLREARRLPAFL